MSNIVQYDIAPWRDDVFSFGGAVAFAHKQSGNTFLISPIGTSIILSSDLITQLVEKKPSEMLRQKLNARGFDGTKQRPSVCNATKYEPEFLMIDITTKCNMNCFYCLRHFEDSGNNISDETLAKILEYIVEYYRLTRKPLTIQPWGGEPLVALEKIFFIDDYLKKADVRFHLLIQTNGILLTDEVARQLHDRNIDVGVSIDGCQTIHDMHRKDLGYQPTYDKVCDGIMLILSSWSILSRKLSSPLPPVNQREGIIIVKYRGDNFFACITNLSYMGIALEPVPPPSFN